MSSVAGTPCNFDFFRKLNTSRYIFYLFLIFIGSGTAPWCACLSTTLTYLCLLYVLYHLLRLVFDRVPVRRLAQRHVLVTGCDYGLGQAIALRLANMQVKVFAACLTEQGVADLVQKGNALNSSECLEPLLLDVTKQDSVDAVAAHIKAVVKERGLWAVVNNAGISDPGVPDDWLQLSDYDAVMQVNTYGAIRVTKAVLPLVKQCRGRVVFMSSMLVRMTYTIPAYVVSKCAIDAYANVTRRELYHFGVSVHTVEPGFQDTPMTRLEAVQSGVQAKWARLPDELKHDYGEGYMERMSTWRLRMMRFVGAHLNSVPAVVDSTVAATVSVWPRIRYVVGLGHFPESGVTTPVHYILPLVLLFICVHHLLSKIPLPNLAARPVLITGCDSGFGYLLALRCLKDGMPVFAACVTEEGMDRVREGGRNLPGTLHALQLDVTSDDSVQAAVQFVQQHTNGLWAVVNNAGIVGTSAPDEWLKVDDYQRAMDVNCFGVIRVTQAFKQMVKRRQGRIVNVASIAGRLALPSTGPYNCSKHAVEAYSDTLRYPKKRYHPGWDSLFFFIPTSMLPTCLQDYFYMNFFMWNKAPLPKHSLRTRVEFGF